MGRTSLNIFNNLNESFEEEFKNIKNVNKKSVKESKEEILSKKRALIKEEAKVRAQKRYSTLKENDWTVTYIPDQNKKDQTATISVSAVNKSDAVNKARRTIGQDCPITLVQPLQEADGCNKKLNETGEWDDNDEEMIAWKEEMRSNAEDLAKQISGECKSVKGFDAYQGPFAVVNSPKHGDVIVWFGEENGLFNVKVAHIGWLTGSIEEIADWLNQDEIPQEVIVTESEKFKCKELKEDDVIEIPVTDQEPDYIIEDVTELNVVGDGDVQAPDIEGLLTLVDESLKSTYGDKWGHIRILSSNKINENSSYALVDISTPEIIKEFEARGIEDAAVGKNLILENNNGKITFKVNSLNGSTKFSKVTENAEATIKNWIETEYLHEAMIEKFEEENQKREKDLKDIAENYIANRPDLRMEIANIEMFIEMGKSIKDEGFNKMIQDRMYGLAVEIPNTIKVKVDKDNKAEMSFGSVDDVVRILFGEKYVKEVSEDNKVIGVVKESEEVAELKESYQQFNIGEIEVVFNPDTFECLYSIPSAEVKDKKINLSEVPSVETPYDTNTIIKDYVEKNFGRIPSENDNLDNGTEEDKTEDIPTEAPTPVEDDTTAVDVDVDLEEPEEVQEAELPEEPTEEVDATEEIEVEEPTEEVPEDKKAETGSAVFVKIRPKQPTNLEDVRGKLLDGDTPTSNYIVVDERDLTDEEWNNLTEDLTSPESYLVGIKAIDRKNYSFNVIKLKNSNANYNLLVDPLGYDYPRYLAIQDK